VLIGEIVHINSDLIASRPSARGKGTSLLTIVVLLATLTSLMIVPGHAEATDNQAITLIQRNSNSGCSVGGLCSLSFPSAVTTGNYIVAVCEDTTGEAVTFDDTRGDSFVEVDSAIKVVVAYAQITSAGADTVTCYGGGGSTWYMAIYELTGAPYMTYSLAVGVGNNAYLITTETALSYEAGDFAVAGLGYSGSLTPGSGFTLAGFGGYGASEFMLPDASGSTDFPATTSLLAGYYEVGAVFQGSSEPSGSTSTSLSCSPGGVVVGTQAACTFAVTDTSSTPVTPSGLVTFFSSGLGSFSPSAVCTLSFGSSSTGTCAISYAPALGSEGTQTITGVYGGDPDHQGSTGTFTLSVTKRATSTAVSCSPVSVKGSHPTTCTVTVTDTSTGTQLTPTGTVSWSSGVGHFSATSCTLTGTGGKASCSVTWSWASSKRADKQINAAYLGDTDHAGSAGSTKIDHT